MADPLNILCCLEHFTHLSAPQQHGWLWNYTIGQDQVPHPFLRYGIQFMVVFAAIMLGNGAIRTLLRKMKGRQFPDI